MKQTVPIQLFRLCVWPVIPFNWSSVFMVSDDFIDIHPGCLWTPTPPWTRTPPEVSCSNKAPTHMSVLRYSQVWWARSHHPQSCPASKQQAQRRGMAGRKEEQVRFIFSYTQWRASGKMIDKEKNKKKNLSPTFYITQKQCAPQPVDPPVHPKVSKFGGRVKKSLCLHAKHYVLP